jgi:hypothetical protein
MRTLLVTLFCTALTASVSSAQEPNYVGVVPGTDTKTENLAAPPGGAAMVTWPGFQMMPDGGSRVFVQTSTEVTPELKRDGQSDNWQLLLAHVALPAGNARRPLDTHFFNTPVKSVRTLARGQGVAVVLTMRAKLMPTMRTERAADGYFFTYLEFPAGSFL